MRVRNSQQVRVSRPAWDTRIEIRHGSAKFILWLSHLAWDARIKMETRKSLAAILPGRIPRGMRGLKSTASSHGRPARPSHPAWDARIEMGISLKVMVGNFSSHSVWSARIEIHMLALSSRIPCGMRGLKLPAKAAKGDDYWSRSAWDARIEINRAVSRSFLLTSRIPRGM